MSLRDVVGRFKDVRALVIGDAIVDVYHWGRCDRISQEAPVPVFVEEREEERQGGASNVAAQLRALRAEPDDGFAMQLSPRSTSVKHRYMVGHQQLFRIDDDSHAEPDWMSAAKISAATSLCDVLILSDYAKGALTDDVCKTAIECARAKGIPIVVDPKCSDWNKYYGATVICPNDAEWSEVKKDDDLTNFMWVAHKRGPGGIDIINPCKLVWPMVTDNYPACARQVFDVTGAGDVVVALIAATLAAKGTIGEAAQLANIAAGYAVGQVGTAVCPLDELLRRIP